MTQSNIPRQLLQKPKFEWNKINSQFKFKQGSKHMRIPLKPTLKILSDDENVKIETKIHIDTEKSLQYENEIGWNWHKSSNLPIISIKLEIRDIQKDVLLLPPANLEAKIFAAKFVVNSFEKDQVAYLQDVGIRGPNNIQLRQGCGFFNGVRFSSTSYNNEGVKFYLVIVVYLNDQDSEMQSNIVCSFLSPPIFVDSRKSARDYQQKRFLSFVELFDPTEFTKLFKKRETRNNNVSDLQTQISNNFQGLYNYLTAPNIRHKVKHPLFLSIKFSNVFKIFYNKNHQSFQQKKITAMQVIKKLQKRLVKQVGGQKRIKKNDDVNKKLFIISMVTNSNQGKKTKVMNALEYLDCKSIFIAQYEYMITQSFANIDTIQNIVQAYAQIYPTLQILSQKQISARKTRQIQYEKSQKDLGLSPKQQIQDNFVKKEHQQNHFNSYKSQRYYPNRSRNENDSQQENFSEDGSYSKSKYRFKSSIDHNPGRFFYQNDQFNKNQNAFINSGIDNTLLQNNLIHPSNAINNSLNLMNQIQDIGLKPILQNPLIKPDENNGLALFAQNHPNIGNLHTMPNTQNSSNSLNLLGLSDLSSPSNLSNSGNLSNLTNLSNLASLSNSNNLSNLSGMSQFNFSNNLGMLNMNASLESYYDLQLNRIRSNQNRNFILKNLLDEVISKSNVLNKMLFDNEMLKNKILIQMNHNNQMFHQMNYMAVLRKEQQSRNFIALRPNSSQKQDFFEDKNHSLTASFKEILSQNRQNLQRHRSFQQQVRKQGDLEYDNIITIRNSSSLQQVSQNNNKSQEKCQIKDDKICESQMSLPMDPSDCKFEENVFRFDHC